MIRGLLAASVGTAALDESGSHDAGTGPGSPEAKYLDWLTIGERGRGRRPHPRPPARPVDIPVHGYLHDVKTGRLVEVPEATVAGAAS